MVWLLCWMTLALLLMGVRCTIWDWFWPDFWTTWLIKDWDPFSAQLVILVWPNIPNGLHLDVLINLYCGGDMRYVVGRYVGHVGQAKARAHMSSLYHIWYESKKCWQEKKLRVSLCERAKKKLSCCVSWFLKVSIHWAMLQRGKSFSVHVMKNWLRENFMNIVTW